MMRGIVFVILAVYCSQVYCQDSDLPLCACSSVHECMKGKFEDLQPTETGHEQKMECVHGCLQNSELYTAVETCKGKEGGKGKGGKGKGGKGKGEGGKSKMGHKMKECIMVEAGVCAADSTISKRSIMRHKRSPHKGKGKAMHKLISAVKDEGFKACIKDDCGIDTSVKKGEEFKNRIESAAKECGAELAEDPKCHMGPFDFSKKEEYMEACMAKAPAGVAEIVEKMKSHMQEKLEDMCECMAGELGDDKFDKNVCVADSSEEEE